MGMLGHAHHPAPTGPSTGAESDVDEETKQLQTLQEELCIAELTAEGTGRCLITMDEICRIKPYQASPTGIGNVLLHLSM
jgi:hypothetical protein